MESLKRLFAGTGEAVAHAAPDADGERPGADLVAGRTGAAPATAPPERHCDPLADPLSASRDSGDILRVAQRRGSRVLSRRSSRTAMVDIRTEPPARRKSQEWQQRLDRPIWWGVPEIFEAVTHYLPSDAFRPCAMVCSRWATVAERALGLHCAAGDALQVQAGAADQVLEEFVAELHRFTDVISEEPTSVASLTLRVHASRCAEQCRVTQTHLRGLMASGDGCDGLCTQMVKIATARRDVCAAILCYTLRMQFEAEGRT